MIEFKLKSTSTGENGPKFVQDYYNELKKFNVTCDGVPLSEIKLPDEIPSFIDDEDNIEVKVSFENFDDLIRFNEEFGEIILSEGNNIEVYDTYRE